MPGPNPYYNIYGSDSSSVVSSSVFTNSTPSTFSSNTPSVQSVGVPSSDLQSILDYQKHLEDREDSAYQRMVEDMKKAGLNPWLAVSSGGLSSGSNNVVSDYINSRISQQKADANDAKTLVGVLGALIAAIALFV